MKNLARSWFFLVSAECMKHEQKENFEHKIILVLEKIMTSKRFFARRFLANKKPGWPAFYLQIYI